MEADKTNINKTRRGFIKTSLCAMGASFAMLSGCSKNTSENRSYTQSKNEELDITPKQTGTYEFSVPLPFKYCFTIM